jgi:hypothetical protein
MWFCDYSGWWGVWLLVVDAASPLEEGLTFGVVGDIHIRVCMSNSEGLRDVASSPHGSL